MGRGRSEEEEAVWQQVREAVLRRENWSCQVCGATRPTPLHVHHRIPRHAGGRDEVSNCITLCDGSHAGHHLTLQVSLARRTMERWALRLARVLDRAHRLPTEMAGLQAGMRVLGVERLREGQLEAVLAALRGESALIVRPTGSGKTLCYQLPALLKGQPTTVVLSPLIALMHDQVQQLHDRHIPATFINSTIAPDEKRQRYEMLEGGYLSFLYLAPERFNPDRVRPEEVARLGQLRPHYLVVDEAHLVDRWGEDFRIDYSRIAAIRNQLGNPPVIALTATAGAQAQQRIKESLGIPDARSLVMDVDRPNIALIRVREDDDRARAQTVARLMSQLPDGRLMLFVPTTNKGREVQRLLRDAGCDLPLYHGQLPPHEREYLQNRFTGRDDPPLRGVICTSAFSMGLDIPDVRIVVNWQHPAAVEDYLQEFGRAGRDGHPALAVLFTSSDDAGLLRWMAQKTSERAVSEGKRTPEQARLTLDGRNARIAEMSSLAHLPPKDAFGRPQCFRRALNEALVGREGQSRRPWSERLLGWAFSRKTRATPASGCCDVCDPELATRVRAAQYVPTLSGTSAAPLGRRRLGGRREDERRAPAQRRSAARRTGSIALAVVVVASVAAAVVAAFGGLDSGRADADPKAVALETFSRYVGAFSRPGEFASPVVGADVASAQTACARHLSDGKADPGRYRLCLLIDPRRDVGRRVVGSYKNQGATGKPFDCRGKAREAFVCEAGRPAG
jgi:ATP-dependent DNA helicase RecQ